jgi:hypothetical protein
MQIFWILSVFERFVFRILIRIICISSKTAICILKNLKNSRTGGKNKFKNSQAANANATQPPPCILCCCKRKTPLHHRRRAPPLSIPTRFPLWHTKLALSAAQKDRRAKKAVLAKRTRSVRTFCEFRGYRTLCTTLFHLNKVVQGF